MLSLQKVHKPNEHLRSSSGHRMNNAHRAQCSPGQINFPVRKGLTMTLDGLVVGNAVAPINCFCMGGRASGFSRRLCSLLYTPIYYHENWRDSESRPQTKGDLIGKIPWLREREITSAPIIESVFGRWNLIDYFIESSLNKFTVITTFADAFPSYLPGRYHNMDCDAIRRYSKDGSYWVNALHFSNICINHGTQPYYNLSHGKSVGLERAKMNAKILQDEGGPELCGTAAEFLFEPWVLLQLPFQPALLHQWAVAALAEAHRFYRRVIEITSRGFAPAFVDFYEKLITIDSIVQNHCHTFIAHFFMIYCKAPNESIHVKARKMLDSNFSEQLAETLAALEFILSDSCTDILNFMKRTSWCKKHPPMTLKFNCPFAAIPPGTRPAAIKYLEIHSSVYTILHWTDSSMFRLCEQDREATGRARNVGENSKKRSTGLMDDSSTLDPAQLKIRVEDFKAFACQNILKEEGPLKGVDDPAKLMDKIMNSLSPKEHSFFAYTILGYYDENIALGTDSPACTEGGVIQQILSLGRDLTAEGTLGAMTRMIWRAAAVLDKSVYLDAGDLPVPEGLTIEDCILTLEACPARKEQWTRQQIFDKAQLTLGHADNFTTRIRALLLKMYEKQYATCEEGPFHFYPECHLVQYVLPCFVAMSLDAQEDTHLSTKLKEEFELFLDALIKSYEQQEFEQLIGKVKKRNFHSALNPVLQNVHDTLNSKFKISPNMQNNLKKFALGVKFFDINCLNPKLSIAKVESEFPIYMLFRRIEKCFEKIGWISPSKEFSMCNIIPIFAQIKNKLSDVDKVLQLRFSLIKSYKSNVKESVPTDSKYLTDHQLFSIALFHVMKTRMSEEKFNSTFQMPFFPLDPCPKIVSKILSRDWWALREIFTPYLGPPGENLDLIPWIMAKSNACCRSLINALGSDKKLKNSTPGEISFFPIQHCRWCGLVNVRCFELICTECKDEPEFPLPNYFCSKGCEDKAMDAYHLEEHARFVMMKLGIWE